MGRKAFVRNTVAVLLAVLSGFALASDAGGQGSDGVFFPQAFLVEHTVTQTDPDGGSFTTEPVTDYYGGSWIVSVRPDDSRLVIDFARREITEIRPELGRYTVISFDRFADLQRELVRYERGISVDDSSEAKSVRNTQQRMELTVTEIAVGEGVMAKTAALQPAADDLIGRPGVKRLRVTRLNDDGEAVTTLEVWIDPKVRLGQSGWRAVESFERDVLGAASRAKASVDNRSMSAVRDSVGGAFPFRTVRPLGMTRPGRPAGSIDDAASRMEPLDAFPVDLVAVPDGLKRAPHPLELMVAHAEREAELNALMGGIPGDGD
jgi:hypothetical protein